MDHPGVSRWLVRHRVAQSSHAPAQPRRLGGEYGLSLRCGGAVILGQLGSEFLTALEGSERTQTRKAICDILDVIWQWLGSCWWSVASRLGAGRRTSVLRSWLRSNAAPS